MSHQPLTDRELRDLVERCDGSQGAKQLALSYAALRTAYEDAHEAAKSDMRSCEALPDPVTGELRLKSYRNQIKCVGKMPPYESGCQLKVTRYSTGPIPKEPNERKSPRCPNCGGLVIEIAGPL